MVLDNIILTIFFLRLQTNIPFIDRILEKLSELGKKYVEELKKYEMQEPGPISSSDRI